MLERGYDVCQVLPRRGERRGAGAQVLRRAAAADELLPDRRGDAAERAGLSGAAERALRRRLLGGERDADERRASGTRSRRWRATPASWRGERHDRRDLAALIEAGAEARDRAHPDALRAQSRPVPRVLGPARRHAARLLQDQHRRPRADAADRARRGARGARAARRHVPRRQDQRHRGPRGAAHRAAQPREHAGPRRRPRRDARGERRARAHGRLRRRACATARSPPPTAGGSPTSSTSASAAATSGR